MPLMMDIGTRLNCQKSGTNWYPSEEFKKRRSIFQGRHTRVYSMEQVHEAMTQFKQNHKKIMKSASHPIIYAWRIGQPVENSVVQESPSQRLQNELQKPDHKKQYKNVIMGSFDNGEKRGGYEIERRVIKRNDLYNVLIIVSRWMQGGDLGPSRFKMIGDAAYDTVLKGGLVDLKQKK